mmetsp:Transcript_1278/g.2356  ORF Transcript_1278/g.2356 Transcript_1278/m.2356 type:complete len:113 (+) Transcript_1278:189-527(+)
MQLQSMTVSVRHMQEKARQIALELGESEFKSSRNWLKRFKSRYGLEYPTRRGTVEENLNEDGEDSHHIDSNHADVDRSKDLSDGEDTNDEKKGGAKDTSDEELCGDAGMFWV